jgi:methyl-accepting chemotaxis protein
MKMNIARKLTLLVAGIYVVVIALSGALLNELRVTVDHYESVIDEPVRQMDQARTIQVTFKKQVQEWKDILLRGHNEVDLVRFTKSFHDDEFAVLKQASALAKAVRDPAVQDLLNRFVRAHRALSNDYQAAYIVYTQHFDFKAADKIVRGRDRAPTDFFDSVVEKLDGDARARMDAQRASSQVHIRAALIVCGLSLAVLGLVGFLTVRSILGRLAKLKTVADRLAAADVDGLIVDVSGHDEIAAFGDSMQRVHAAIEELVNSLAFGAQV